MWHPKLTKTNTDPVSLAVLQHPHLLLQSLALPLQLLFPLTCPLGFVPRPLELRLQPLQLQVGQSVQAAGALKGQGGTVQHWEEKREESRERERKCRRETRETTLLFHCFSPD